MTRKDIIRMAREAGFCDAQQIELNVEWTCVLSELAEFAVLVATAEREKLKHELLALERWKGLALAKEGDGRTVQRIEFEARAAERKTMIADGWRQCAQGQRTTQFCGQLEQAVAAEREQCAKVCDEVEASMQNGKRTKDGDHAAFTAGIIAERIRARGQ